jgi:hypothetical protein
MLEYFLLLLRVSKGRAEAKFLVPDRTVRQPYAIGDYIPLSQGTKNLAAISEKSEVLYSIYFTHKNHATS